MNQKTVNVLVLLTFLLVLGLYVGGYYLYQRYQPTIATASQGVGLLDNIISMFKGK